MQYSDKSTKLVKFLSAYLFSLSSLLLPLNRDLPDGTRFGSVTEIGQ